jgi:hypothetical protein
VITHIEDAYEQCPDCGCPVPPGRVDPPAPDYDGDKAGRTPLRPSFDAGCCPTCGSEVGQPDAPAGGHEDR